MRRYLPQMSAAGAGAVLAAALGTILPEALAAAPALVVAVGTGVGFAAFWAIEQLLARHDHAHAHGLALGAPDSNPSQHGTEPARAGAHRHDHDLENTHSADAHATALVPLTFTGDALHNFVDGVLIAAGFLSGTSVGVLTLMAVALHELPRELGTFGILVHGGVPAMRAVRYNLATGIISLGGALLTLAVGATLAASVAPYVLPLAAGTYLYIGAMVLRSALRDTGWAPTSVRWGRLVWATVGASGALVAGLLR